MNSEIPELDAPRAQEGPTREILGAIGAIDLQKVTPRNLNDFHLEYLAHRLNVCKRLGTEALRLFDTIGFSSFKIYQSDYDVYMKFYEVRDRAAQWNRDALKSPSSITRTDYTSLEVFIKNWHDEFIESYKPFLPHLVLYSVYTDAYAINAYQELIDLKKKGEEAYNAISSTTNQAIAKSSQNIFAAALEKSEDSADNWLLLTSIIGVVAGLYGLFVQLGIFFPKPKELSGILGFVDPQLITYWVVGKIAFGVFLLLSFTFSYKAYRAAKHNHAINLHRASSLAAIIKLEEVFGQHPEIHQQLLMRAAEAIFSHQPTGFTPEAENSSQINLMELMKTVLTKGQGSN